MAFSPARRRESRHWVLLGAATASVWAILTVLGAPSAALFSALLTAIVLALTGVAPKRVPKWASSLAQAALGVVIGSMVHADTLRSLGADWLPAVAVALGTLAVSVGAGALLGLRRDVDPLTGSLSLIAGGATGLVAIARELGGDDRMVAVIQYLRVALVVLSLPVVAVLAFDADTSGAAPSSTGTPSPWYLGLAFLAVVMGAGLLVHRFVPMPAGALLAPLTIAAVLELTDLNFGATVPAFVLPLALVVVGWQAGVAFDRESLRAIGRTLPVATVLIIGIGVVCAGFGVALAHWTGATPLEGYLATTPGGLSAVLAISAASGANATFVAGVQLIRLLLMLFLAPLLTRGFVWFGRRRRQSAAVPELVTTSS
ncbi:AbrB family transcriptional regulator [Aldersonia sp. NBC_00410]|uniref:AbrB family transcriptional regulator n=1 Tax=Aldersonia sp. NBC_00410 TaxID=2975954 RepID=UPI00225476F7|nr:AbrB family transcriptional regulator [Aldersonia sp. NBC_00410]MCX5043185.1 AbrB family transcriptional regulator [Aldersonia sp. NBC_00410]